MRVSVTSISLRNFRSIGLGELSLSQAGLVLLEGPSGAGKTTLFQGLSHALMFGDFSQGEIQSWGSDEKPHVEVGLSVGDERHSVSRTGSTWAIDGKKAAGAALATAAVRGFVGGLSPELVRTLTYLRQNERKDFLSLDSSGKYEFLASLLPEISALEDFGEEAKKKAEALRLEMEKSVGVMSTLRPILQVSMDQLQIEEGNLKDANLKQTDGAAHLVALRAAAAEDKAKFEVRVKEIDTAIFGLKISEDENVKSLDSKILDVEARRLEVLRGFKPQAKPETKVKRAEVSEKLRTCQMHLLAEEAKEKAQKFAADSTCQDLWKKEKQIDADIKILQAKLLRIPTLAEEEKSLLAHICPTCSRQWEGGQVRLDAVRAELAALRDLAKTKSQQEEEKARVFKARAEAIWKGPSDLTEKLREIQTLLSAEAAFLDAQMRTEEKDWERDFSKVYLDPLQREINEIRKQKDELVSAHRIKVDELRASRPPVPKTDEEINKMQIQVAVSQRDAAALAEKIEKRRTTHREMETKIRFEEEHQKQLAEERRLESAIAEVLSKRGFLSMIFQELLDEISQEANKILSQVANVSEVSIAFVTESETADGRVKREIRVTSTVRGHPTSLQAGVSGGMANAIRLAVQLAIRRVVSRRMGVYPSWLILDEPFDGMGPAEKEMVMELLSQASRDELILVVDHATEFKGMFSQIVKVRMEKGVSTLEVA